MSGVIYLDNGSGQLEAMTESPYDSEDILQGLLEDHSDLLAGEQMNSVAPRRWLLLEREAALPDTDGGVGRWSVDHLFVDQDGVPTIVEVKRSSDTRIRREVVGQMLDYAANAVVYWPVEQLRSWYEAGCSKHDVDPNTNMLERLDVDIDIEAFWQLVKTNLQAGRVRMVFVGDVIPNELRRVIEFLNVQMSPAEVLAVEIKQYVGNARRALVPRVVGQTQQAAALKTGAATQRFQQWNEQTFLDAITASAGEDAAETTRSILRWARTRGLHERWGRRPTQGSWFPILQAGPTRPRLFSIWSGGGINIEFIHLKSVPPFDAEEKRLELLRELNRIPGITLPIEGISKWPWFSITMLASAPALDSFLEAFDCVIQEIRASANDETAHIT